MANSDQMDVKFEGEEAGSGFASPTLDLIASAILVVIAAITMAASLALPVPGEIHTAPGLLPFIIAASLLLMAIGLGASAIARRRSGNHMPVFAGRDLSADLRSIVLAFAIGLYIATLQVLAFRHGFSVLGVHLNLTAFEPATILALSTFIHLSWRGPLWITVAISVTWTVILSLVFQLVFRIPLPGSF